jgi:hypothetical protein
MDDLDKIALGRHDRIDILVGARRLVNYPLVFAAFDTRSGGFVIGESEGFPRGPRGSSFGRHHGNSCGSSRDYPSRGQ